MKRSLLPISAAVAAVFLIGWEEAPTVERGPTVRFANSGVTYEIPRTYLIWPSSPEQPNIAVTYPDLGPASEAIGCETWMVSNLHHRCGTFDFLVSGGQGPTRRQMAENLSKVYTDDVRISSIDEYGFYTWWSKNVPSAVNFTRGRGSYFLFFSCYLVVSIDGSRDGPCDDIVMLSDGNSARFIFPYHLRNELPAIEESVDRLMKRFRVLPAEPAEPS